MYSTPKSVVSYRGGRYSRNSFTIPRGRLAALQRRLNRGGQRNSLATRSRTRTATQTATRSETNDPNEHRGGSESFFNLKRKPVGKLANIVDKLRTLSYVTNSNVIQTSGIGKQAFFANANLYYPPDIVTMQNNASTVEFASTAPTGYKSYDIYLKSAFMELAITNSENAATRLVLYDCIYKKDIATDADNTNAFLNQLITDGVNNVGGGATGYQTVGTRPYDSPSFNEYVSVRKTTTVILAPGQTHYHTVRYEPCRRINAEQFRSFNGNLIGIQDLTYGTLIQQYGTPVKDATTGVTVAPTNNLVIARIQYKYAYLPSNMSYMSISNNLATTQAANLENEITGTSTAFAQV